MFVRKAHTKTLRRHERKRPKKRKLRRQRRTTRSGWSRSPDARAGDPCVRRRSRKPCLSVFGAAGGPTSFTKPSGFGGSVPTPTRIRHFAARFFQNWSENWRIFDNLPPTGFIPTPLSNQAYGFSDDGSSPKLKRVAVPPRRENSHSASVGRRYSTPSSSDSHRPKATASFHDMLTTECSPFCGNPSSELQTKPRDVSHTHSRC